MDNSSFSNCSFVPTAVTCYFTPVGKTTSNVCSQSVEQCDTVPTSDNCVCDEPTGTGYKYSLNFKARQSDHGGGDFSCDLDCTIFPPGSGSTQTISIAPSCLNIAVGKSHVCPGADAQWSDLLCWLLSVSLCVSFSVFLYLSVCLSVCLSPPPPPHTPSPRMHTRKNTHVHAHAHTHTHTACSSSNRWDKPCPL